MKNLTKVILLLLLTITSCKDIGTVSPDWFVTDIEGYQLIFRDDQGKVYNAMQSRSTYGADFVTVKKEIKRNGENWIVTTKLEDALIAVSFDEVADLKDADVVKIPLSRVATYTRIVR